MKEIRIGLTCYGGVSLAIYMFGLTKEIHKMVSASAALDRAPEGPNPFARETETEHTYFEVLRKLEAETGIHHRVVVDIISGTSAGGINGICLAKAISHNLALDPLRDVWLDKADVSVLLRQPENRAPWWVRYLAWPALKCSLPDSIAARLKQIDIPEDQMVDLAYALLQGELSSGLDGDFMLEQIFKAFSDIRDTGGRRHEALPGETLVPEGGDMELHVTGTDYVGLMRHLPIYWPDGTGEGRMRVLDNDHRVVLSFRHRHPSPLETRFDEDRSLTFAARITSSFPAAFTPVALEDVGRLTGGWPDEEAFVGRAFAEYELVGSNPDTTRFIDGGVLDNKPFGHVIGAIARKSATTEVVRRLVYVEPDPVTKMKNEGLGDEPPSVLDTVAKVFTGIRGQEPIIDDLRDVDSFNWRVRRAQEALKLADPAIRTFVDGAIAAWPSDGATLAKAADAVKRKMVADRPLGFAAFMGLKGRVVAQALIRHVCTGLGYPDGSSHALLAGRVVRRWLASRNLMPVDGEPTPEQVAFLGSFDQGYRLRRLRLLTKTLNRLLRERPDGVARDNVLRIKGSLHDLMEAYERLVRETISGRPDVGEPLDRALGREVLDPRIRENDFDPAGIVEAHGEDLDIAYRRYSELVAATYDELGDALPRALYDGTDGWPDDVRRAVLYHYLGFPLIDAHLFPIRALAEVGELDQIRVTRFSPRDKTMLEEVNIHPRLKGYELAHFGAFLSRPGREKDYLWGRLNGVERMIDLVADAAGMNPDGFRNLKVDACVAVVNEETPVLTQQQEFIAEVRKGLTWLKTGA